MRLAFPVQAPSSLFATTNHVKVWQRLEIVNGDMREIEVGKSTSEDYAFLDWTKTKRIESPPPFSLGNRQVRSAHFLPSLLLLCLRPLGLRSDSETLQF